MRLLLISGRVGFRKSWGQWLSSPSPPEILPPQAPFRRRSSPHPRWVYGDPREWPEAGGDIRNVNGHFAAGAKPGISHETVTWSAPVCVVAIAPRKTERCEATDP